MTEAQTPSVPVPVTRRARLARRPGSTQAEQRPLLPDKNRAAQIVNQLLGRPVKEDLESLFPDDAKEVSASGDAITLPTDLDLADKAPKAPAHPAYAQPEPGTIEPMMTPVIALVAPDVTPQATDPIDPSLVPAPGADSPAMQTLLGKDQPANPDTGAMSLGNPSGSSLIPKANSNTPVAGNVTTVESTPPAFAAFRRFVAG